MTIEDVFKDESIKAKAKVVIIGDWLLNGDLPVDELIAFASQRNGKNKATCIESIEYSTKKNKELLDASSFEFILKSLKDDEPRVKWESAKVIANVIINFKMYAEETAKALLKNTKSEGTVVRWATALALVEILKLKTEYSFILLPKLEKLMKEEGDNGIKKKYLAGIDKIKK